MNSRIYKGKVRHTRFSPVERAFTYPIYFYAIDLSEYDELTRSVKGFAVNATAPIALRENDYLIETGDLRSQIEALLKAKNIDEKVAAIQLITMARFMRKVFKPVNFYYCLNKADGPIALITEVNNTFGERHLYVLADDQTNFPVKYTQGKEFHVSPFNNLEGNYKFSFSKPGEKLRIGIQLQRDGKKIMQIGMWGEGKPLTTANLWATVLRYPLTTALTMPRILWQAAIIHYRLHLPVFHKPTATHPMTIKKT